MTIPSLNEVATRALTDALLNDNVARNAIFAQAIQGVLKLDDYKTQETLKASVHAAVGKMAAEEAVRLMAAPEMQAKIRAQVEALVPRVLADITERAPKILEEVFAKAVRSYGY